MFAKECDLSTPKNCDLAPKQVKALRCSPDNRILNALPGSDTGTRTILIDNLVGEAVTKNFDGFDLDFESGVAANGRKATYTAFVKDLAAALKTVIKLGKHLIFEIASNHSLGIISVIPLPGQAQVARFRIGVSLHPEKLEKHRTTSEQHLLK